MFLSSTRNRVSNATIKQIKQQYTADLSELFRKEDSIDTMKTQDKDVYILRNGVPIFQSLHREYIPTVKCVHLVPEILKRVVVDEGAIKHLINGADVMAPGLLHQTSDYPMVTEGELVAIYGYDKTHALGVGRVLMTNDQVEEQRKGIAIKSIAHLGDKVYSYA
ncbi:malignant T-cell-amplified sequence [Nematocida sp. AWRm80]|nr:malignant T-cell-amplified sequence [Nematocida sp. AWRm80]